MLQKEISWFLLQLGNCNLFLFYYHSYHVQHWKRGSPAPSPNNILEHITPNILVVYQVRIDKYTAVIISCPIFCMQGLSSLFPQLPAHFCPSPACFLIPLLGIFYTSSGIDVGHLWQSTGKDILATISNIIFFFFCSSPFPPSIVYVPLRRSAQSKELTLLKLMEAPKTEMEYWASTASMQKDLWKSQQICRLNWRNREEMLQIFSNVDCHR